MSSYRRIRARQERQGPNGCLVFLVVLIWIFLGLILLYQYYWRPQVSQQIGQQISQRLGGSAGRPTTAPGQPTPAVLPEAEPAAGALPTLVAALPSGEIRVTEQEANAYLVANATQLQPIESATLHFVPGVIQADVVALGQSSTASMSLAIQNGRVVTINPQINGPLGALVDLQGLIGPLEQQLNDELSAQGRRITDVRIEQGVLVFTAE
jgi:hypothetical protein